MFSHSYWESLLAESYEAKSGKLQLPSRWADLFTNTFRDLNQYCNLNFTRHYVYVKSGRLMRAYFYCNFEEYQLRGTCELFSDKKMNMNFKVNQIKQAKGKAKSFQSR